MLRTCDKIEYNRLKSAFVPSTLRARKNTDYDQLTVGVVASRVVDTEIMNGHIEIAGWATVYKGKTEGLDIYIDIDDARLVPNLCALL